MTQKIEKRAAELLIANEELCFQNEEKDKRGTKLVIASEFRIAATVFESQEGMFITDANSSILRVNRAFTRIAGYSGEEAITVRADMGNALRKAIKYNQFQLYYQIQVSRSDQALGAKALIRWQHPERGQISPVNFIR